MPFPFPFPLLMAASMLAANHDAPGMTEIITGGVSLTFGGLAIYVIKRLWDTVDKLMLENKEMTAQLTLSTAVLNEVKELLR